MITVKLNEKMKQKIKFCAIILVVALAIAMACFMVIKYQVEGEKNVPFKLGKIIVISSASTTQGVEANQSQPQDGNETGDQEEKFLWNEKIVQTNDIYIYIDKNKDYKEQRIIKTVKIDNIKILEPTEIGKIQIYMPNSLDSELYKYIDEYLVNYSLTYKGASVDNKKNLEIGNQGGCVCISFANMGLDNYKSNEDEQIEQGAFILKKMNLIDENLKFRISFDVVIEIEDKSYKTNVILDLPADNLVGNKESHYEINDFDYLVYKRM